MNGATVKTIRVGHTDNHMQPLHFTQNRAVFDDVLVSRQQDMESTHAKISLQRSALSGIAFVGDDLDGWSPFGKLPGPIGHGRKRNNDEVRTTLIFGFDKKRDEGNSLNGFSQTLRSNVSKGINYARSDYHFVGQDSIQFIVVQTDHPL